LERDALREARAVVQRMGVRLVSLPGYPVVSTVWALCVLPPAIMHPFFRHVILGARGGKRPSLHVDLGRAKGKSEIEYLNGAIVQAGQRLGVPTPVNRFLCETVLRVARGEIEWSVYRGQVKRLIAEAQRSRA
jgi:2-dehydropantoate 2-reductase